MFQKAAAGSSAHAFEGRLSATKPNACSRPVSAAHLIHAAVIRSAGSLRNPLDISRTDVGHSCRWVNDMTAARENPIAAIGRLVEFATHFRFWTPKHL
jgi:hypothetical protein